MFNCRILIPVVTEEESKESAELPCIGNGVEFDKRKMWGWGTHAFVVDLFVADLSVLFIARLHFFLFADLSLIFAFLKTSGRDFFAVLILSHRSSFTKTARRLQPWICAPVRVASRTRSGTAWQGALEEAEAVTKRAHERTRDSTTGTSLASLTAAAPGWKRFARRALLLTIVFENFLKCSIINPTSTVEKRSSNAEPPLRHQA
ncbi:hypothetical protein ACFW04_013411 [Cataglyphis niger]